MSTTKVKRRTAEVSLKGGSGPLGQATAVVATLGVVDLDGDYATAETFTDGQELIISAYNHSSMTNALLPVGKGRLAVRPDVVTVEAEYFMMNESAREAFEVLRAMGASQEWSYGYKVLDSEPITIGGVHANYLKNVQVFEASPVVRGAGIATRTLTAKEIAEREYLRFVQLQWCPQTIGSNRDAEANEIAAQEMARFYLSLAAA